ncbi:hypothetical protein [Pseudomonas aeruginosa]|uniref:hypothetical protein n=1 Tax=Pseudomonas aeruginosa TaxID=287 RepID=UPI001912E619|nr:hypothetical protein [Pseudomonas aeruginosa]WCW05354.1 hypothetical protein KK222_15920 [Pseudomonas aeruginosa]
MNDRTLLELAARAAGMNIQRSRLDDPLHRDFLMNGEGVRNPGQCSFPWNPRDDDGDALRLAVKLGIVVTPDRENQRTLVSNSAGHEYCAIYWDKLGEMAATRLAITEAAAEIGKSMRGGE